MKIIDYKASILTGQTKRETLVGKTVCLGNENWESSFLFQTIFICNNGIAKKNRFGNMDIVFWVEL